MVHRLLSIVYEFVQTHALSAFISFYRHQSLRQPQSPTMEACLDPSTMNPHTCPAGLPPPGILPMSPYPERYSPHGMEITMGVSLIIVVPAIAIRLFTKGYILRLFQAEDCKACVHTCDGVGG